MQQLKDIWDSLVNSLSSDESLVRKFWQEIETQYAHPQRYYHNLSHLQYMVQHAFSHREKIENWDVLLFSIFYHDIVYKVTRSDNEQKSADLAKERLSLLGFPTSKMEDCIRQILATKDHTDFSSTDTQYLLDFDLAILGEGPDLYQAYAQNIRKEYAIYPDFLYKKGRKKVIKHFLDKDFIFKSSEFKEHYEQQARLNLQQELASLE